MKWNTSPLLIKEKIKTFPDEKLITTKYLEHIKSESI